MKYRVIEVKRNIMQRNDALADALRKRFAEQRLLVVNVLSSPGSGKTTLLEDTLARMRAAGRRCGALVGDQATDNDARRLARTGAPVRQITTGEECRLDADMISKALLDWDPGPLEVLLIENVGNLICPAEYDLGEELRVVLFSVTEGEDKPLKYPLAFNTAHVALITKTDIAGAVRFDREAAQNNIRAVNPEIEILEISVRSGDGLEKWMALLENRADAKVKTKSPA